MIPVQWQTAERFLEHLRLDQQHAGQAGIDHLHRTIGRSLR